MSEDLEFIANEDSLPIIPEGQYEVMYKSHKRQRYYNGEKLYVAFEIVEQGPYLGTKLFRAYNLYSPMRRGSDLFKDLELLFGNRVKKKTKLPLRLFQGKVLKASVRTVRQNKKQVVLLEHQQYSVVDSIISVLVGGKIVCLLLPILLPVPTLLPTPIPSSPPKKRIELRVCIAKALERKVNLSHLTRGPVFRHGPPNPYPAVYLV